MHKLISILISLFFLSCVTEKHNLTYNQILPERYVVYNNFPSKYGILKKQMSIALQKNVFF